MAYAPVRLPRRHFLTTLVSAAAVAGCGGRPTRSSGGPMLGVAINPRFWNTILPDTVQTALVHAAARAFPSLRVTFSKDLVPKVPDKYTAPLVPVGGPGEAQFGLQGLQPLDPALRAVNTTLPPFVTRVLPGFTVTGSVLGLPQIIEVARILVNTERLGHNWQPPAAPWTLNTFIGVAENYAALHFPAPALGGDFNTLSVHGAVVPTYVWAPFVLGFGASTTDNGRLAFTSDSAVAGLSTLVQLVQNCRTDFSRGPFILTADSGTLGMRPADISVQPYPRMPVRAVLPYAAWGWGLWGDVPSETVLAAVRFMLWLYEPAQVAILRGAGLWSVADGWSTKEPVGAFTQEDMSDMNPSALFPGLETGQGAVGQALQQAVQSGSDLKSLLTVPPREG